MDFIIQYWQKHKKQIFFSEFSVFFWGMAAHAYMFFNNSFSHDSLNEFQSAIFGNQLRYVSGRIFVPLYRILIRGNATMPWFIGMLSLGMLGLTVYLILRLFKIESPMIGFIVAGILTTNISVSATVATYIHDLDSFQISLLAAVAAVYLWSSHPKGWLWGVPLVTLSLGMYQAYVTVSVSLTVIFSVMKLMNGADCRYVFTKGLYAIAMILLGGAIYYLCLKLSPYITGISLSTGDYNSMDRILEISWDTLPGLIRNTYKYYFLRLWDLKVIFPVTICRLVTVLLVLIGAVALINWLADKKAPATNKLLTVILLGLLPLTMNTMEILNQGLVHDLMVYAIWFTYLLFLLLSQWLVKRLNSKAGSMQGALSIACIFLLIYSNIQMANHLYLEKDMAHDATLSAMTRIVYRMEETEGYVPGETPVVFVGLPSILNKQYPGFQDNEAVTGMTGTRGFRIIDQSRYQAYFDYVLCTPINMAEDWQFWEIISEDLPLQMPSYPNDGFLSWAGDVLVVNLGNPR